MGERGIPHPNNLPLPVSSKKEEFLVDDGKEIVVTRGPLFCIVSLNHPFIEEGKRKGKYELQLLLTPKDKRGIPITDR